MMACGTSRTATSAERELRVESGVFRDSVDVKSIEVRDTLKEVTTITVQTNDKGDTLKVVQVTERDRISNRDRARDSHEKTVIKTDTVFIERRDSVYTTTNLANPTNGKSGGLVSVLRWIFWIIVAFAGVVLIRKKRR